MKWRNKIMNKNEIVSELKEIILTFINIEDNDILINDIDEDDILYDGEFGLDSASLINMIVEIERRFSITIDDEFFSMDMLSSLNSISELILQCLENANRKD